MSLRRREIKAAVRSHPAPWQAAADDLVVDCPDVESGTFAVAGFVLEGERELRPRDRTAEIVAPLAVALVHHGQRDRIVDQVPVRNEATVPWRRMWLAFSRRTNACRGGYLPWTRSNC
jgi:hypothetical protein